jgi:hypothetical protein
MERVGEGPADGIFIHGLNVHARHGLLDHEAQLGQRFVIDIDLQIDLCDAASSDDIGQTIDYASVVATATEAFLGATCCWSGPRQPSPAPCASPSTSRRRQSRQSSKTSA